MEKALARLHDEPESFPSPSYPYASPRNIVFRDGRWRADNGYCRHTREVQYFYGTGPATTANCKPNEVDVPRVVGLSYDAAVERLGLQPLEAKAVYKPAVPRQRVGYVLGQLPKVGGRLSAYDTVTLVVAKPLHGVVPRVVGLRLAKARATLDRRNLRPIVTKRQSRGRPGRVLSQEPRPGVAAAPRMPVTLVVSSARAG
jgi:beta-lactam-binding protein with PASTA domain